MNTQKMHTRRVNVPYLIFPNINLILYFKHLFLITFFFNIKNCLVGSEKEFAVLLEFIQIICNYF